MLVDLLVVLLSVIKFDFSGPQVLDEDVVIEACCVGQIRGLQLGFVLFFPIQGLMSLVVMRRFFC